MGKRLELTEGKDLQKKDIVSRLCKLSTTVGDEVFDGHTLYGCFCGANPETGAHSTSPGDFWDFHFDEEISST